MKQEQKRLAKEAVEERMKEQGEERPDPDQLPIVQSIATPSQGVSLEPRPEEGRGSGGAGEERAKELIAPGMPVHRGWWEALDRRAKVSAVQ